MNTLVVNLTRFGDLLQSQPTVTGLARGGSRIGLVCLENFVSAARLLNDVDHVQPLAGSRLLSRLDVDWRLAADALWRWRDELGRDFPAQDAVVLTSSSAARLLSRLLRSGPARGFALDADGFGVHSTPWASFLTASSMHRGCSPFNLVDLFWKVAGLPDEPRPHVLRRPSPEDQADLAGRLAANRPADCLGHVAFQLGASVERRTYPVERFAALGDMLWQRRRLRPVLLGTASEAPLGRRFAELCAAPAVDLMGQTSLGGLSAALLACRLLVTNDTGTMHLAAGLGVPIVSVFLVTAQPWDTGPYLPGSLCLEPDLDCHPCGFGSTCARGDACRFAIPPETLAVLIEHWLERGGWPDRPLAGAVGARAWESVAEPDGFLALAPRLGRPLGDRGWWAQAQRHFYKLFLDGRPTGAWPFDPPAFSEEARGQLLPVLRESGQILHLLSQQVALMGRDPRPALRAKFMGLWQRLEANWIAHPRLGPLGRLWAVEAQEAGQSGEDLRRTIDRYAGLMASFQTLFPDGGPEDGRG